MHALLKHLFKFNMLQLCTIGNVFEIYYLIKCHFCFCISAFWDNCFVLTIDFVLKKISCSSYIINLTGT